MAHSIDQVAPLFIFMCAFLCVHETDCSQDTPETPQISRPRTPAAPTIIPKLQLLRDSCTLSLVLGHLESLILHLILRWFSFVSKPFPEAVFRRPQYRFCLIWLIWVRFSILRKSKKRSLESLSGPRNRSKVLMIFVNRTLVVMTTSETEYVHKSIKKHFSGVTSTGFYYTSCANLNSPNQFWCHFRSSWP